MEDELGTSIPNSSQYSFPQSKKLDFSVQGLLASKKFSINGRKRESMNEEPLFSANVFFPNSQRTIGSTKKNISNSPPRQSFDSLLPKGRLEHDLKEMHQNHILLRRILGDIFNLGCFRDQKNSSNVYKCIDLKDCQVKALKIIQITSTLH